MVKFSADPKKAEQEMHAIIFYLTTFGYIDGDFDAAEKSFVRDYIRRLIEQRADGTMKGADAKLRSEVVDKYTKHFHEVFEGIDKNVKDLFTESVGQNEDPTAFVHAKLKVKCFEIFKGFDHGSQEQLMHTIDDLLMADGTAHPAELKFRGELAALLESHDEAVELVEEDTALPSVTVHEPMASKAEGANHPFFFPTESHYSADPSKIQAQINSDLALVNRVMSIWDEQRKVGAGKLKGKHNVQELAGEPAFLDGNVYSLMPKPGETYELTVLGDLHGCYSVFKAALLQSKFFERVDAWRKNPTTQPHPKLVLLGDYIDRGLFSLNGVLRTVLQLFATAPEHVYVLRGNHEYYIEFKGTMYGGVKPAEAINTLKPHLPIDVFRRYRECFEQMPNMLLFDRMLFVHGGIAKDRLIKERVKDLSGLNDPDVRFQMMWSDPSTADVIPADLQDAASRFAFGRMQFRAFMQKIGCHTMIRGHEKVEPGFVKTYDDEHYKLFTLFSAGGKDNGDLPSDSSYRSVTPMALTITLGPNGTTVVPWAPDYKTYNDPSRNAFFRMPPEIEFKQ